MKQNDYTELYFVRHAESDISVKDERTRPLTAKGHRDAQQLCRVFTDITIDHIYSSPYVRTVDTLKYLAESRNKQIVQCSDLRERAIGRWVDDFFPYAQKQWNDFQYALEHGESLQDVQERNMMVVNTLLTQHERETVLIGTHGTALGTICNYYEPQFGFEYFRAMVETMPYIIKMLFEKHTLKSIREVPLNGAAPSSFWYKTQAGAQSRPTV